MDHVGENEGGGSPEALRPNPCAQAVMDPGPVPMQGESLPVFQDRVVYRLRCIAKEEQKLAVMKEDLRKKKSLHSKSGNSKREVSKLKSLEEALKKQEKLVASLKESSGVFKEKYENEERFQQMKKMEPPLSGTDSSDEDLGKGVLAENLSQCVEDFPEIAPANRSLQSAGNAGGEEMECIQTEKFLLAVRRSPTWTLSLQSRNATRTLKLQSRRAV
ncbi:hypothetical protein AB205_0123430 [Aquarana catesbeiana]|uniref:Uncharacterized protein n=1 Tax=Aquarana catesbeiana TaxID=8400 RepID=A0A2G9R9L8_AQUCT|nr:hypothetical protein AB205_0123430 [Aquarana catesbeiana]